MARTELGRLGLLLGGLALGLVLAEGLARVVQPNGAAHLLFNGPDTEPAGLQVDDRTLRTALAPDFSGDVVAPGWRVHLRTNSLGLRGPAVGPKRGPRWLVVGDSFALSAQVSEEDTFEGRLAARTGAEFWNNGVDGDSTWQETGRLQRVAETLQPDGALLLFFLGNDLYDNEEFPRWVRLGRRRFRQPAASTGVGGRMRAFLTRHSFFYAWLRVWQKQRSVRAGDASSTSRWREELSLFTTDGQERLQQLLPVTRQALLEFQQTTVQLGVRPLVAVAPPVFSVDPDRLDDTLSLVGLDPAHAAVDQPRDAVLGLLEELGLPACDLTPALRASDEETYLQLDGHWTPAGHAVVADAVAACLDR